jgi:hypothetical protein
LRIGSLVVATIPGEFLPKLGLDLRKAMPGKYKMIFGLTNDELGYLIPADDWRPKTEYEETMSVGKEAGNAVKNSIISVLTD